MTNSSACFQHDHLSGWFNLLAITAKGLERGVNQRLTIGTRADMAWNSLANDSFTFKLSEGGGHILRLPATNHDLSK